MMTLRQLMETFPTDDACKDFLFFRRWPDGSPHCPRCGKSDTVYNIALPWKWECTNKACRKGHAYRFSLTAGTIFENTKYPLKTWFEVLWQMLNSKKGVSALQIQRQIGCKSYQTAWYMCHRLRASMHDPDFKQLMGIVEVDETFIGGKQENRHWKDRQKYRGGGAAHTGKTTVIGAIWRIDFLNVFPRLVDILGVPSRHQHSLGGRRIILRIWNHRTARLQVLGKTRNTNIPAQD